MNIFYLDENEVLAAEYHCDSHVRKMVVEYSQLLSTVHHVFNTWNSAMYKPTHVNHPCNVWLRQSADNYMWLSKCLKHLQDVYFLVYGYYNKSFNIFHIIENPPYNLDYNGFTDPPQAMPEYLHSFSSKESYRDYYLKEKTKLLIYKNRKKPYFIP